MDFDIDEKEKDYCVKAWEEFTTLTEEANNLKILRYKLCGYVYDDEVIFSKIRCIDTGKIYKNLKQAAQDLGVSSSALSSGLKAYGGVYTLRNGLTVERI